MALNGKYRVFKAEDWARLVDDSVFSDDEIDFDAVEIEDCFVLRSQDLFGAAGLFGYAHTIQTGLELDRARPGGLSDEERERLATLADDVVALAIEWQRSATSRVPD